MKSSCHLLIACWIAAALPGCGKPKPQPAKNAQATTTPASAATGSTAATTSTAPAARPVSQDEAINAIRAISKAIPIYAGATVNEQLTRRDQVMARNQSGPNAVVYTLATEDAYPEVYHYYTTYLAQFRAYHPQQPYPPQNQTARTMDVQLNQAMQDPFIPGDTIPLKGEQVTLQVAENEGEPHTLIRYIITPNGAAAPAAGAPGAR